MPLIASVSAASSDNSIVTTGAIDTTGATFLVGIMSAWETIGTAIITDNKSNTWVPLTARSTSGSAKVQVFYVVNPTVGSSHTFTGGSGGVDYPSLCVAAFSGVVTSTPFDQQNGTNNVSGTSSATGSVTPSEDNELVIAGLGTGGVVGTVLSIDSSLTVIQQVVSAFSFLSGLAWIQQGAAGAINPTWSWNNSATGGAVIATFKTTGAWSGGQPTSRRLGAVPFVGGQGVLGKAGHGGGRMYGRSNSGRVIVPAWLEDEQRRAA